MNRLAAAVFVLLAAAGGQAHAHAFLDHAQPRVGATVQSAPAKLTLTFTQEIEPAFSSVKVTDAQGRLVDKGDVQVQGALMQVTLAAIGPGDYTVTWRVVSVDTHVTEGDFVFHVGR
jgi:methionine-rich copper-binding protein CopC